MAQASDKEFNEMLSSLQKSRNAKANTRELRAPKPLQTHSSKCNSWSAVAIGFTLNESKQYIPTEKIDVPLFASKNEESYVAEVANMLRSNSSIHVVITTGEQILGQAFQGKADLVTQYHPEPIKQFAMARVVYKNEGLR